MEQAQKVAAFAKDLAEVCRRHGLIHTVRVELGPGDDIHEFPGLDQPMGFKWVFHLLDFS